MKNAKKVVIYSGAGISTASGIADVASKNKTGNSSMNRLQA
jgi:NAD-dependent SIR2 family protein deacetylase